MSFFDNNAIAASRRNQNAAPAGKSPEEAADIYPLLIEHAAVIVGKTLRPSPGMFKFRSKLLKCTFDKGDIWAFVVRGERQLVICSVSCGPYKEFSIIDEIPFHTIEEYQHTQSKSLRLPEQREVRSRRDALALVAGCMKRKPADSAAQGRSNVVLRIMESIRTIYHAGMDAHVPAEKIMTGLETMFSDALTMSLPGEKSLLMLYNESVGSGLSDCRVLNDVRLTLLNPELLVNDGTTVELHKIMQKSVRDLIQAVIDEKFSPVVV